MDEEQKDTESSRRRWSMALFVVGTAMFFLKAFDDFWLGDLLGRTWGMILMIGGLAAVVTSIWLDPRIKSSLVKWAITLLALGALFFFVQYAIRWW